jgi:hypothetical protein
MGQPAILRLAISSVPTLFFILSIEFANSCKTPGSAKPSPRSITFDIRLALPKKCNSLVFSVYPLGSLCLCGGFFRGNEFTTEAQRTQRLHREETQQPTLRQGHFNCSLMRYFQLLDGYTRVWICSRKWDFESQNREIDRSLSSGFQ